jgi:hypothetical protein
MKFHFSRRKPDALLWLALLVGLGAVLSTSSHAEEFLFSGNGLSTLHLSKLMDGDLQLAPVGRRGGVLQMSFQSPSQVDHALYVSQSDNATGLAHGVCLSVKLPW